MNNTNYIGGIVKILEFPKERLLKNGISVTECRAQLPYLRGTTIVQLKIWGNLAKDVLTYYKTNDYILIEGYLSLADKKDINQLYPTSKKIVVSVSKLYPFLLSFNRHNDNNN